MWTSTLDLKLNRVLLTRLLGLVYPNIYYSPLSPLRVANIARPMLPSASWVRVRNRLAGICGSDLPLVRADADIRISVAALPNYKLIYPGHEVVGEVIEIGEGVQQLRVGDRVVLQYGPNCLSSGAKPVCRACSTGHYNLCEYGSLPGPQPIGGGWSEEMLLHEHQLFRLPNELSDEQGVMLEPTAIALHAILRHLPQENDDVLIIGAGTIGLLTLHVLHALVPKARISVFARYPSQVEYATRLGADHIIYPIDPYASVQRVTQAHLYKGILGNRTMVGGYDVIYDTVGQQNTLHHALRWLRTHGTMVLVGINLHMMHIDLTPIWHQEVNLLGSLSHGRETWPLGTAGDTSTFSAVTELMLQNRICPEQLITHRFALDHYKEALLAAQHKKQSQAIKVLFDYALLPASAVPNVRASARSQRTALAWPQVDMSTEEGVQEQNVREPQPDWAQEAIPQSNGTRQTLSSKIIDTPRPQAVPNEAWSTILQRQDVNQDDSDEDTDPTIPVRRAPYSPRVIPRVVESPQTPIPPAMEPTPTLVGETPETDESGMNTLTEEQLPTQTVLDNLFDADTSSMPEFLAQLSNLGELNAPVKPVYKAEDAPFADSSDAAAPIEHAEVSLLPDDSVSTTPVEHTEAPLWTDSSDTATPVEYVEAPVLPDSSNIAMTVEHDEAPLVSDDPDTIVPAEHAEVSIIPDDSVSTTPVEHTEAPLLPDSSDTAAPSDAPDQTDSISATTKLKARRKRKASSSPQTSTATTKDAQGEKQQNEEEMTQEVQSEQATTQTTED